MFWTIGQFPELDHLDEIQRREVLRRVPWHCYPRLAGLSLFRGFFIGAFVALGVAIIFARFLSEDAAGASALATFIVTFVFLAIRFYLGDLENLRKIIRTEIAAAFKGQRLPFCFSCGYDFRNLAGNVCPECGHPVSQGKSSLV